MAKGCYVGVSGVARKVKKGYVGVNTEFPIYQEQTTTKALTGTGHTEFFTATKTGTYDFTWNSSKNRYESLAHYDDYATNATWTAKQALTISFNYGVSSESNYDKFYIYRKSGSNSEQAIVSGISGTTTGTMAAFTMAKGDTLRFYYSKDTSGSSGDDCGYISNVSVTATSSVITGYETRSVARKIKKAYVGIGGVARPCWSGGELAYYGTLSNGLFGGRYDLASATAGDYALFAGGNTGDGASNTVDAYNSSLIKYSGTISSLYAPRYEIGAASVGDYALFLAGHTGSGNYRSTVLDYYNSSLTRAYKTNGLGAGMQGVQALRGTTVGDYAIFGGLYMASYSKITFAYNASITLTTFNGLSSADRAWVGATTIGNYALFAGGNGTTTVDAIDASLTTHSAPSLSTTSSYAAATTVGDYALVSVGFGKQNVDAYNSSLTKTQVTALSYVRQDAVATSLGKYALFAAGGLKSDVYKSVETYDSSLTKTNEFTLSIYHQNAAAVSIGNYALIGGGNNETSTTTVVVEAFTIA